MIAGQKLERAGGGDGDIRRGGKKVGSGERERAGVDRGGPVVGGGATERERGGAVFGEGSGASDRAAEGT